MSEDTSLSRRSILKKSSIGIGIALGGSGSVNAAKRSSQEQSQDGWITVENGLFSLNTTPEEIGESRYQAYQDGIDEFNESIASGDFTLKQVESQTVSATRQSEPDRTNQYVLIPSGESTQTKKDAESIARASTASCNRSDAVVTKANTLVPGEYWVNIYLSSGDITDLGYLGPVGSLSGATIYNYLVSKGIIAAGALAGPAAAAVGLAIAIKWAEIGVKNNGCGVKVETGYSPVNPSYQYPSVKSQ